MAGSLVFLTFSTPSALILEMDPGQYRDNYLSYLRNAESNALRDPEPDAVPRLQRTAGEYRDLGRIYVPR